MRPALIAVGILVSQWVVSAGEPGGHQSSWGRDGGMVNKSPRAWLGLRLEKPDPSITAHVPSLPPGIGFLVKAIDKGGPAESAGFQELDLLWKLGDQMLVNEGQLFTLLRLSKPGEEVVVSGFRGGKPLEIKIKLGEAPVFQRQFPDERAEAPVMPGEKEGPMRQVNVAEKSASFSSDEGSAVVWRDGEIFKAKITGPKSEIIFDGELSKDGKFSEVPEEWRRRTFILARTLKQALEGNVISPRQPRPRVLVPDVPTP